MPGQGKLVVVVCVLILVTFTQTPVASAAPDLPPCRPFDEFRKLLVSPTFREDHTLFVIAIFDVHKGELARWALLRSTDAGHTWTRLAPFEPLSVAASLNYAADHTLYVKGKTPGKDEWVFWRTTDGGDTWTMHSSAPTAWQFVPVDPQLMVTASFDGAGSVGGGAGIWRLSHGRCRRHLDSALLGQRLQPGRLAQLRSGPDVTDQPRLL